MTSEKKTNCDVCGRKLGALGRYSGKHVTICGRCYTRATAALKNRWTGKTGEELRDILSAYDAEQAAKPFDEVLDKKLKKSLMWDVIAIIAAVLIGALLISYTITYYSHPHRKVEAFLTDFRRSGRTTSEGYNGRGVENMYVYDFDCTYTYEIDGETGLAYKDYKEIKESEIPQTVTVRVYRADGRWKEYDTDGYMFFFFLIPVGLMAYGMADGIKNLKKRRFNLEKLTQ